ncbi:heme peroxidase [Sistotremastrum niveocremeum HHB9708]|uniref:linoleate 8R-lipoxygenase n=1 Tax=Sistotremastrum niveocremeum HHB9708 TaxID=1314777 RepID=A0A164NRM3_9AGAM|nr:heme peroxidase [Sistotremastrum niveocremeum HHB9708]
MSSIVRTFYDLANNKVQEFKPVEAINDMIYTALEPISQVSEMLRLSHRPLYKDGHVEDPKNQSLITRVITQAHDQTKRGNPMPITWQNAVAIIDAWRNGETQGIDDRKLLLEQILTLVSRLPPNFHVTQKLKNTLILHLYNDLPHPPSTFIGSAPSFSWSPHHISNTQRLSYPRPDGSFNNPLLPSLGSARMPYARTVPSVSTIIPSALPDPAVVFDTLLRRPSGSNSFNPHPSGLSSLFFGFATLITHTLFRTSTSRPDRDNLINATSSYLDLSPLYGVSEDEMRSVRRGDGTGRLWSDTWADPRIINMPPSVAALLVVFNRNHNFMAEKLLQLNERGNYKEVPALRSDTSAIQSQDDSIFNTARLINTLTFTQIILTDYLSCILGTIRSQNPFVLDPLQEFRYSDTLLSDKSPRNHELVPRGEGNHSSYEFNMLYRWHSTLSAKDVAWSETKMKAMFPGKDIADITPEDFGRAARSGAMSPPSSDPRSWELPGLHRKNNGGFEDGDVSKILKDATEEIAHSFGARSCPSVMKVVEILGIVQARKWGVGGINEFRKSMGLKEYKTFQEWNPSLEIATAAQRLYGTIDNLELYVGLQAEETKPVVDGSGLCPGYTISRAILADAVVLTRGDRFLTIEQTPHNLTSWGYMETRPCSSANGSIGGTLQKLLFRTLPYHYTAYSAHAHFPFIVPRVMRDLVPKSSRDLYKWERPSDKPRRMFCIESKEGAMSVLHDWKTFGTNYGRPMKDLTKGYGFFLCFDADQEERYHRDRKMMQDALYPPGAMEQYKQYYYKKALELIRLQSTQIIPTTPKAELSRLPSYQIDIVKEVLNYIPIHFVCNEIAGIPLKTPQTPNGVHTEQEVYEFLGVVFAYIFLDIRPEKSWAIRDAARKVSSVLQGYIENHLEYLRSSKLSVRGLKDQFLHYATGESSRSHVFLERLLRNNLDRSDEELTYNVFACIIASGVIWSHAMSLVIDFYLDDERAKERFIIQQLCTDSSHGSDELLVGYCREALRLNPQTPGVFRVVNEVTEVLEGPERNLTTVIPGDEIFVSLSSFKTDSNLFPQPAKIDPTRPATHYGAFGLGPHTCLGASFTTETMPEVLRAVFSLPNVRRAPGSKGKIQRFDEVLEGNTLAGMFMDDKGGVRPWPVSMVLEYDD